MMERFGNMRREPVFWMVLGVAVLALLSGASSALGTQDATPGPCAPDAARGCLFQTDNMAGETCPARTETRGECPPACERPRHCGLKEETTQ
jgi:hypothetical protein